MSGDLPLHVETRGDGAPILLLHGFGASRATWRPWVPALERRGRLHLVDLKGCGDAPKPPDGRYGPQDQAGILHRYVMSEDLRDLTVVGHSLGGGIALLLALLLRDAGEADRLRRLVLISAAAYVQGLPHYIGLAARAPAWLARLVLALVPARPLAKRVLKEISFDPQAVTEEEVERYAAPLRARGCRRALADSARQLLFPGLDAVVARYPEIGVPALLLWGRQDDVVPPWVGERLARELPRGRLVMLERCGHLPMDERSDEALEAITGFLEEG